MRMERETETETETERQRETETETESIAKNYKIWFFVVKRKKRPDYKQLSVESLAFMRLPCIPYAVFNQQRVTGNGKGSRA